MSVTAESTNSGLEDRPILPENELRHIPYGCAVLLPRGQAPVPLHLYGNLPMTNPTVPSPCRSLPVPDRSVPA